MMETVTLKNINDLLENAPESVLERVYGYIEGIIDNEDIQFKLTEKQKESLREIKYRPYSEHTEIETFVSDFKDKYGI